LGQRQGRRQRLVADGDRTLVDVENEVASRANFLKRQGQGCVGADEQHLDAKGDGNLVAIVQWGAACKLHAIEVGAILATEIMQRILAVVPRNADVMAGHLPLGKHDVAVTPPAYQKGIAVNSPLLAGQLAFTGNDDRLFVHDCFTSD
jgi:hypothetical protein